MDDNQMKGEPTRAQLREIRRAHNATQRRAFWKQYRQPDESWMAMPTYVPPVHREGVLDGC